MYFEEVLPALRKGRKVRRRGYENIYMLSKDNLSLYDGEDGQYLLDAPSTFDSVFFCDDWEVVPILLQVADFLVPKQPEVIAGKWEPFEYYRVTLPVDEAPPEAIMVPDSVRAKES
jgi:hypothetical protein